MNYLHRYTLSKKALLLVGGLVASHVLLQSLNHLYGAKFVVDYLNVWLIGGSTIIALILLDALLSFRQPPLSVEYKIAQSLSVGRWQKVSISIRNSMPFLVRFELYDKSPEAFKMTQDVFAQAIAPNAELDIEIKLKPLQRGRYLLGGYDLRQQSRWGFWIKTFHEKSHLEQNRGMKQPVKVYPDFRFISEYIKLAMTEHTGLVGIKSIRRRGTGSDFHQLREYQQGDALRQIDWKATTRHNKLISKEYQDERQQQLLIVLDCGKRMRGKDSELSHFDYALNASLLLAYVALKQGDAVGMMTIGGTARFIPVKPGTKHMNELHNQTYDLQPTMHYTDFLDLATRVEHVQRKRGLVVVISQLMEEDSDNLQFAIHHLKKKQLVMFANINNPATKMLEHRNIDELSKALDYCGKTQYYRARKKLFSTLQHGGNLVIDTYPEHLMRSLVNEYHRVKKAQLL